MSNSIWKMPDVKPKKNNDIVCMVGDMFFIGSFDKYQGLYKSRSGMLYDTDEIDRWGYLEDIIAQADKAERLQKAVDSVVDTLKKAETTRELTIKGHYVHAISLDELHSALKEIKQLIKEQ